MSARPDLIYLNDADLQPLVTMPEAIALAERGIEADAAGEVAGDKFYMDVGEGGFLKPFAGYAAGEEMAFVKVFSFFEQNRAHGLPVTDSQVILYQAATGLPVAIMEGEWLTGLKTGASTAVAATILARSGSRVATIFGAGRLGRHHAVALDHVFDLEELRVVDTDKDSARRFVTDVVAEVEVPIRAVSSAEEAVRGSDIVVTVTTGSAVNVEPGWLMPGAFVARLGSYREVAGQLFETARLVVDRWEYVSHRVPEMVKLIAAGRLRRADAVEWLDIVAGRVAGRQSDDEVILYVALGIWGEYAAILPEAYRRARAAGLGTVIIRDA